MASRTDTADMWDAVLRAWSVGTRDIPEHLLPWSRAYRGAGEGAIELDAFPEPYTGNLATGTPSMVLLGLNPGQADLSFQGPAGTFTREVARRSYRHWAAGGPYTGAAWEAVNGRNVYHRNRVAFARRWHDDETVTSESLLVVELFPWHSKRVTAAMRPPLDILREWVWEPLAEIDVEHVFAFGKPWLEAAERAGLGSGRELTVAWDTPSRHAVLFDLPGGQQLVVAHQGGYAGPPGAEDTVRLRSALRA